MEELQAILCDCHVKFKEMVCDEVWRAMSWKSLPLEDSHSSLGLTLEPGSLLEGFK